MGSSPKSHKVVEGPWSLGVPGLASYGGGVGDTSASTRVGQGATGAALFVHDFVAVGRPMDEVLERVGSELQPERLAVLICRAWHEDADLVRKTGVLASLPAEPGDVDVHVGVPRFRSDAVVLPLRWSPRPPGWLPNLDADLEIASFGDRRTHVHLLGRYELPTGITRMSSDASLVQRMTVALVRQVLAGLSEAMEARDR
jgi:hypothetical protein